MEEEMVVKVAGKGFKKLHRNLKQLKEEAEKATIALEKMNHELENMTRLAKKLDLKA